MTHLPSFTMAFFSRRHVSPDEQEARRASRAAGIRGVLGVTGIIFLVLVAFIASMLVLTPLLELASLEQEKEHVQELLRRAKAEEEEARNRYRWLSDREYFEQLARDRANLAKDGEIVVRRPTMEEEQEAARRAAERARIEQEKADKPQKPAPRRRKRQ